VFTDTKGNEYAIKDRKIVVVFQYWCDVLKAV